MKLFRHLVPILLIVLTSSAIAEDPKAHCLGNARKLIGAWDSFDAHFLGDGIQITFGEDGSIQYELRAGGLNEFSEGFYTVGKSHIYFWVALSPADAEKGPADHSQGTLMTYRFQDDDLKLTFLKGADRHLVTLKKSREEPDPGGKGE